MYRFEKLIVNLSLTESDVPLLRFAGLVSRLSQSKSALFLYAREAVEVPASLKAQYPWLMEPVHTAASTRAREFVEKHFSGHADCAISITIEESNPAMALLAHSLTDNIDLILIGDCDHDRSLAIKLARKAPCSVLLVPKGSSGEFSSIGLGLDLSRYSDYALDVATAFAAAKGIPTVHSVTYYAIPYGFHKTNLPREPFEKELRIHTLENLRSFIRARNCRGIEVHPTAAYSAVPGASLLDRAKEKAHDLIIIGCRGRDALTATLLGSNTEDILRGVQTCAALAVKEKGTGRNFLEALLGLTSSRSHA